MDAPPLLLGPPLSVRPVFAAPSRHAERLHKAFERVFDDDTVTVGQLVLESGLSHRHFLCLFRRAFGLAPKAMLRVVRFERVLRRLAAASSDPGGLHRRVDWAGLAVSCGYFDQAHLVNECRRLTGHPPVELLRRLDRATSSPESRRPRREAMSL